MMIVGEKQLREHLHRHASIRAALVWEGAAGEEKKWRVRLRVYPQGGSHIDFVEDAESFPTDFMIAQVMLVA